MSAGGASPIRISVDAGERDRSYEVIVAAGLRRRLPELLRAVVPARWYVVVSDSNVAALYGEEMRTSLSAAGLRADLLVFPAGEVSKSRTEWARLSDAMLAMGVDRSAAVLAVGGGVTGDLAGFVAATYLRGVPVVQVPTTLLSMIDASVGGKTGVNVPAGKNLVGAFHPPAAVIVDPEFTDTLSRSHRAEGLAEAIKHGAIRDAAHMSELADRAPEILSGDAETTAWAVEHSVRIKAGVVSADERESGLREILNFGHTMGHAFEAASRYGLSHGAAVALGMVLESELGEQGGVSAPGTADRMRDAVTRIELSCDPPPGIDPGDVLAVMQSDKKGRDARPRFVLLDRIGEVAQDGPRWSRPFPDGVVEALVQEACLRSESA